MHMLNGKKNMGKKLMAVLLSLACIFSTASPAFAEEAFYLDGTVESETEETEYETELAESIIEDPTLTSENDAVVQEEPSDSEEVLHKEDVETVQDEQSSEDNDNEVVYTDEEDVQDEVYTVPADIVLEEKDSDKEDFLKVNINAKTESDDTEFRIYFWQYDGNLPQEAEEWKTYFTEPFENIEIDGLDPMFLDMDLSVVLKDGTESDVDAQLCFEYSDITEDLESVFLEMEIPAGSEIDEDIHIRSSADADVFIMAEAAVMNVEEKQTMDYLPLYLTAKDKDESEETPEILEEETDPDIDDEFLYEDDDEFEKLTEESETEEESDDEFEPESEEESESEYEQETETETAPDENNEIQMFSTGTGDILDGDYAYVSSAVMDSGSNDGYAISTGTAPWDSNDNAGNDSGANNKILRTYDTATYTVDIMTQVRSDAPYGVYVDGNLYFELLVEGSHDEIQWETGSMGWLESKHGVYTLTSETNNGTEYQVLRGYITLEPSTADGHAIGNTAQTLDLTLRALAMQNGDQIVPKFTFFLAYNDVGITDAQYRAWGTSSYNGPMVTFDGQECSGTDEDNEPLNHGKEYATITAPEITISAAPRYNLSIVNSTTSKAQQMGSYDFSTGNSLAADKEDSEYYGRLGGYGLVLQIVGKDATNGLRGVQLPAEGEAITINFVLDLSSTYTSGSTKYNTGTISNGADLTKYAPRIWSFDENKSASTQQDDRTIPVNNKYADQVPYNKLSNNAGYNYASCYNGGSWNIEGNGDGTYNVSITGCLTDMNQLPYTYPGAGTSLSYSYYNPNNINYNINDSSKNNYWEVETACFSAGEVWVVQPYYAGERNEDTYIAGMLGEGTFSVTLKDSSLEITQNGKELMNGTSQTSTSDDSRSQSMALVNPGSIDQHIAYVKYNYTAYNDPLTDGCFSNAKDWILQGDQLGIETYVTHDQAEEGNTGVAYDVMLKFDDTFFEPTGTIKNSSLLNSETRTSLWAAKPDGSGWDHKGLSPDEDGYDSEMINATPDDLIFYTSLNALKNDGKTCVGVMIEYRGLMTEQQNHIHTYVLGTSKTSAESDQVYMVTPYCRSWNRDDLAAAMAEDEGSGYYGNEEAALSALMSMTTSEIKTWVNKYIPSRSSNSSLRYEDADGNMQDYPSGHWVNGDSRHPTTATGGSSRTPTILNYEKCRYDENGCHEGSSGNYWGDSCLLVGYTSGLTLKVAQQTTNGNGASQDKSVFDMDTAQTVVDYEVNPYISRNNGETSGETMTTTEVVVTVTLPENLSYIEGSSYIGGTYSTNREGSQGTVTGGTQLISEQEHEIIYTVNSTDYVIGVTLTVGIDGNGNEVLTYVFTNVPVTGNENVQYLPEIYFSCEISSGAVENNDELDVTAAVSCSSDSGIDSSLRSNGEAIVGITVTKNSAVSLVKTADQAVAEVNEELGYTMDIGDNSENTMTMTAVDSIPYNGDGSSTFANEDCKVYVTEFSAYDVTNTRDLSGFYFFYTTDESFAGATSSDYPEGEYFVTDLGGSNESVNQECIDDGWVLIDMTDEGKDAAGHEFYDFTDFPQEQVYAIAGIGEIQGNDDISMHVTLKLTDPEPGDIIINKLSQQHSITSSNADGISMVVYEDLIDSGRTSIVGRSISGFVWLDEDADGGINTGTYPYEQLLSDVDVELQIRQDEGIWTTAEALKAESGQSSLCTGITDEDGYYEFDYLPEGEYRIIFSGNGIGSNYEAYSLSAHDLTVLKADGIADGANSKAERISGTDMITGIILPSKSSISGSAYAAEHQNAGYTKLQSLNIHKTWVNAGGDIITDPKGVDEITVLINANGIELLAKLNPENSWSNNINGLPYYDGSGMPADYVLDQNIFISETDTPHMYTLTDIYLTGDQEKGYSIELTNSEEFTEISGIKTWEDGNNQDGNRPDYITIELIADGEIVRTVNVTENDGWSWIFENLPKYRSDGTEIQYAVMEYVNEDYSTSYGEDGEIINSYEPSKTSVSVTKYWDDNNNQDGLRTGSVTVELLADGAETGMTLTLDEANNWTASFKDLDEYHTGTQIEYSYTIKEYQIDGYEMSDISGDMEQGYIITNSHEPETISINGSKTWDDNSNLNGIRPDGITIRLSADGEEIDSMVVTEADGWSWTFDNLPKYRDGGIEIAYTIAEDTVDQYETVYDGYDVTNRLKTYGFNLQKTDGAGDEINGAAFTLSDEDGTVLSFAAEENVYTKCADDDENAVTELPAGSIRIEGLPEGKYTLKEVKAPDGYLALTDEIILTISEGGVSVDNENDQVSVEGDTVIVENVKASALLSTGGFGTRWMLFLAIGMIAASAALLVFCSRKHSYN